MQIFDSFSFFNELDLLELRLKELDPVVDYFVLIESNLTHSKKPKPYIYGSHATGRFDAYADKIIYVKIDGAYLLENTGESHWDREALQRDSLIQVRLSKDHVYGGLDR